MSAIPHKELRFLVPVLPLLACVIGIGLEPIVERLTARWVALFAGALGLALLFRATELRYRDLGQLHVGRDISASSVWSTGEGVNRALADVGRQRDVCGVAVIGVRADATGGYSYLHRRVPLLYDDGSCVSEWVNYAIVAEEAAAPSGGFERVSSERGFAIYRRPGSCQPVPASFGDPHALDGSADLGLHLRDPERKSLTELRMSSAPRLPYLGEGWSGLERVACLAARWAVGERSSLRFALEPSAQPYVLELQLRPHEQLVPLELEVIVNGQPIAALPLARGFRRYPLPVPVNALRRGENTIELRSRRTAAPTEREPRRLSVLVSSIELYAKQR
jgi:hypothetical protein